MVFDKPLSPSRTLITSFTPRNTRDKQTRPQSGDGNGISPYEEGDWVLCLTTDRQESLACGLSNGQVQVYDTQRLHLVNSFQHASPGVTDLIYGPQHSLLSSGREGSVRLYDLRQQQSTSAAVGGAQAQVRVQLPLHQPALCLALGYDGYVCAVGSSKGRIHFVDIRNPQQIMGSYTNSHRDDVTQVQFSDKQLLSGSDDGLMCLFDTTRSTEETALSSVLNVGAPVGKVGFCGDNSQVVYCLTGNETLSLLNAESTTLLQHYTRDHFLLTASAATLQQHDQRSTPPLWSSMDYLVDAHWDARQGNLQLLAGGSIALSPTSAGNSALFRISGSAELEHVESMVGGHCGVIRAWCPLGWSRNESSSPCFITAGEDARLCEWQLRSTPTNPSATMPESPFGTPGNKRTSGGSPGSSGGGGGPFRRPRQRHKPSSGSSPY